MQNRRQAEAAAHNPLREENDMRIERTGKIIDGFYVVGHSAAPVFLLDGPFPVLFDAGFTGLSQLYERGIKHVLGSRSPRFLFLTHSHWDHVGAAAHLKQVWPEMKIAGSLASSEILARPRAIAQIKTLNQGALEVLRSWGIAEVYEGEFKPFAFDVVLKDARTIKIDPNRTVEAIPAPGHTWDGVAYWMPERKILVAGEATGCDGVCEFLVDHEAYRDSLMTLSALDVQILCIAHRLVFTGSDVEKHMTRSINQVPEYVNRVERYLREEKGDVDRVVARVKAAEWDKKSLPKQPLEAYLMNTKTRVKTVKRCMGD